MTNDATPNGDDLLPDEDLVAYLDGELDTEEASAVESRIARDAKARSKAEAFRKTYDLLDYLPKPEPSPTFATRTLTKLDTTAPRVDSNGSGRVSGLSPTLSTASSEPQSSTGFLTFLLWAVAALFAGTVGYFGHLLARPHLETKNDPPAMQQVRLLEYLPLFLGVDDLAYLKALDESELFSEPDVETFTSRRESVSTTELVKLEGAFQKLPPARQQQLRQLDEDFNTLEPPLRDKLCSTLERYAVWLDRLNEKDRRDILNAPASKERVEIVRLIKNRLWRESLPDSWQQRLKNAAGLEERDLIYSEYRQLEAGRKQEWHSAKQIWSNNERLSKPFPFENAVLAKQVEDYVNSVLKPRMYPWELAKFEELRRDTTAGGYPAWYFYGAGIFFSSELHPSLPEPKTGKPLTRVEDFPTDFLRKLRPANPAKPRREFKDMPQHGKWPDFAEEVDREAAARRVPVPFSFGPSRPGEFKPEVEAVLTVLRGKLTTKEKNDLDNLSGKWPQYPKHFLELARRYDLTVTGVTLPGAPSQWNETYRFKPRRP